MKLGMQVGLGPGQIVSDADPGPLPLRGTPLPQLSAHICCGQTAGWIKMPLDMEVGLGPGHIVLDATQLPASKRGTTAPNFRPMSIMAVGQTAEWIKMAIGIQVNIDNTVLDG